MVMTMRSRRLVTLDGCLLIGGDFVGGAGWWLEMAINILYEY